MNASKLDTGKNGETLAAEFLKKNGYRVIEKNFKNYLGEIDIIAKDKKVICFVEVRTRTAPAETADILESVGSKKQYRLSRLALSFLKDKNLVDVRSRFDVVSVRLCEGKPEIELIKGAFELNPKFS
ncbi:MAG TPA: YraN family protein [Candidatus Omnitrophota bacterium]|nr:YraN family protein [Candidatus Omnitrophota bacterium]